MREKNENTHILIERQLRIYQRERSAVWQCAFNVDGRWQRTSTNERELAKAKKKAHDILVKANVKKELNIAPITRKLKDIATVVVKQLEKDIKNKTAKPIYKDYISILNNYIIPILGKYNVNNISREALDEYEKKLAKKMRKPATYSTQLTHNAVLNMIFDEAVLQRFMTELDRPKLVAKGKVSERRPAFDLDEIRALRNNFNDWISRASTDTSKKLRTLLREYVYVLLDTGARPGKELLNLRWKQIRYTHNDKENGSHVEMTVSGKTGKRKIIGWSETIEVLKRQLKEQGLGGIEEVTESNNNGYVFRMADGKEPQSFQKLFETFLKQHNLLIDPNTEQKRVFYSLRHTYATFKLTYDKTPVYTLAEHMGTSVAMIEKHYGHLKVKEALPQLKGDTTRELLNKKVRINPTYHPKTEAELKAELKEKRSLGGKRSGESRRQKIK
jgi:integrase